MLKAILEQYRNGERGLPTYDELIAIAEGAQADARPVGEWVKHRHWDAPHLKWAKGYVAKIGDKLYTHPEASAPRLSERERYLIDKAAERLREADFIDEASAVRAILTRASAATVAEPSKIEPMRYDALEKAASEARAHIESECEKIGVGKAAQQQAEPGADERAAWDAFLAAKSYPGQWREQNAFYAGYRAGQRAGVAEDANLLRDAAEKGLDINQQPQLGCVEVWAGKGDDALVFREYYSGHADREAATKCALKRALAAPTQQQEGQ